MRGHGPLDGYCTTRGCVQIRVTTHGEPPGFIGVHVHPDDSEKSLTDAELLEQAARILAQDPRLS